ncbi:MAG: hypothetical protein IJG38_14975 [Thermoguttaceae bacterium]|nr:hypothetical protein [Thermoguttaceae bacterium]MBQ6616436.1 hypothetical protein [Thermoguttaceae bacterium]
MKQFITRAIISLFVLSGVLFIAQTCFAAVPVYYANQPVQRSAYVYPAYGTQVQIHPVTPTQMRTGYTRKEIRSMPMIARPSRPGHFIGNTVRRRAGVGY